MKKTKTELDKRPLIHALDVARQAFVKHAEAMRDAAKGGDNPMFTAEAMTRLASEFDRYAEDAAKTIETIDEADAIIAIKYGDED